MNGTCLVEFWWNMTQEEQVAGGNEDEEMKTRAV